MPPRKKSHRTTNVGGPTPDLKSSTERREMAHLNASQKHTVPDWSLAYLSLQAGI